MMKMPTHDYEQRLGAQGYRAIAGVDEVGRGAWAGPLLAAAVILPSDWHDRYVRDSKTLPAKRRAELYDRITTQAIAWAIGSASVAEIDEHGLGWANEQAMERAVAGLSPAADVVLADGTLTISSGVPVHSIVDGDADVFVIAAASIVAKVTRDRLMAELDRDFPAYGFVEHVGYGTARHSAALREYGPTEHHRRSFAPIKALARRI